MAGLDRITGTQIPPDMNGVPQCLAACLPVPPCNRRYPYVYTKPPKKSRAPGHSRACCHCPAPVLIPACLGHSRAPGVICAPSVIFALLSVIPPYSVIPAEAGNQVG